IFSIENNVSLVDIFIPADEIELLELYIEDHLIRLLQSDDLRLDEIEIWEYLVKWGIKNTNSILTDDLAEWNQQISWNLKKLYIIAQYKDIFPDLSDELFRKLDPRQDLLNSRIINAKDAALIATWIDNKRGMPCRFKEIPIKFEFIYRASQEHFSINKFHESCDNKEPAVVIIKVLNSEEIIGGYNPLDWRTVELINDGNRRLSSNIYNNHRRKTSKSFILSLLSSSKGAIPRFSRISTKNEAIIR
ncbi:24420_t:CDS:2, partial [Racocetra persica]